MRVRRVVCSQPEALQPPNDSLLFDPQTAGGVFASVPAANAADWVAALRRLGYTRTVSIGRVLPAGEATEPIHLRT